MKPYYQDDFVTLFHADCRDVIAGLPENSVDAIITDPPYELGFMGKGWDKSGIAFETALWADLLRVLKPGGHIAVFGAPRTWHRLAVAIEDAGFQIRDSIAWIYGQGFPKSMDVSKAIDKHFKKERPVTREAKQPYSEGETIEYDTRVSIQRERRDTPVSPEARTWQGWGTQLKPAFEPVVVARKPLVGTVAKNVLTHGVGALNIDATRIPGQWTTWQIQQGKPLPGGTSSKDSVGWNNGYAGEQHPGGRHPSNLVLDESAAAALDSEVGTLKSGALKSHENKHTEASSYKTGFKYVTSEYEANEGGPSRFFPVFHYCAKAKKAERPRVDGLGHPTVKPLGLMQWLVRLLTPPGGTILDPFAGSGTTVEAALLENKHVIAAEVQREYLPLIEERIHRSQPGLFSAGDAK